MGVKVTGLKEAGQMILQLDTITRRRVVRELFRKAGQIQQLAIKMAPRDYGGLEQAIKVRPESLGRERNELGQFARTEVEVYIDMDAQGQDPVRGDVKVGDYAYEVHEYVTPSGSLQLGPQSVQKQGGQAEVVGGGFMDRAVAEVDKEIDAALREIFNF